MANLRTAAALLLVASLLVAVALSGADGRPAGTDDARSTVRSNEMAAHTDALGQGYGHVDAAAQAVLDPECNGKKKDKDEEKKDKDKDEKLAPHPSTQE